MPLFQPLEFERICFLTPLSELRYLLSPPDRALASGSGEPLARREFERIAFIKSPLRSPLSVRARIVRGFYIRQSESDCEKTLAPKGTPWVYFSLPTGRQVGKVIEMVWRNKWVVKECLVTFLGKVTELVWRRKWVTRNKCFCLCLDSRLRGNDGGEVLCSHLSF